MVLGWWRNQPFDLDIPPTLGNCDNCWKKSIKVLTKNAKQYPGTFDWWRQVTDRYQNVRQVSSDSQTFYRRGLAIDDIFKLSELSSLQLGLFDDAYKVSGCGESCEVY